MTTLNPLLNAYRSDLADQSLEGKVQATHFVASEARQIMHPVVDLKRSPAQDAGTDSQLLFGETVQLFEDKDGWAWVQNDADRYVGYVEAAALVPLGPPPTHRVRAQRSFRYPGPDLRFSPVDCLSIGSTVRVTDKAETRHTPYALLDDGTAMIAHHLEPLETNAADYVAVAEDFLHTPYLWGGRSGFGVDCSTLVQLSMAMAGRRVLRDTSMQVETIGTALGIDWRALDLQRGDLIFWHGHVAIMLDATRIIHASGGTMDVTIEPLADAVTRIACHYDEPVLVRRP